jgi:hypothetical protein
VCCGLLKRGVNMLYVIFKLCFRAAAVLYYPAAFAFAKVTDNRQGER